ncbi:OmpA family protein [Ascidiimonas sp. W6]|uniref:OmpA family protein n=1 Tax=Ascidiimonas meishanensis TaxID=3128903 RepID=UPI0030EBAFE3
MAIPLHIKTIFIYIALTCVSINSFFTDINAKEESRFSASTPNSAFFAPNLTGNTYKLTYGSRETIHNANENYSDLIVVENGITKIKTDEIFFDYDKSFIRPDASVELNKLVAVLNANKSMIIRIEAHTDSRGSEAYNLKLSNRRANSSKDYLIQKGIHPDRIISAKGFGEQQLVNECGDGIECSESAHQFNRRSEFIIVNP